ncbi:leucine-rich repeat domain-containing protein [Azonexus sp.]|uniref:leucine-rich repeat domain-containing protein n=1 Tax=Azonexus sp. TaxID=1872668 RepID=UPI0035B03E8F
MPDELYDQYSDEIFYANTLAGAQPDKVRAIYISYEPGDCISLKFPELRYLSYCQATPDWGGITRLKKLVHFSCKGAYGKIPQALHELLQGNTGLIELEIDNTGLHLDDRLAGIGTFKNLRALELNNIELPAFPAGIGQLGELRRLSLANSGLRNFPDVLCELHHLEELDLSGNPISELPEAIGQLHKLRKLDITQCALSSLPESLADLPDLESVLATGNTFTQLPFGLKKLKSKLVVELKYRALYDEVARKKHHRLGQKPAIFKDFGFKLMVIQKLMYDEKVLRPIFDVYDFAANHSARKIDLEGAEAYGVIPEVRDHFLNLEIPLALLEDIKTLYADGGDEIYAQLAPRWGGEDDFFNVNSAADAKLLPNLKEVTSPFLSGKAIKQLEKLAIEVDC